MKPAFAAVLAAGVIGAALGIGIPWWMQKRVDAESEAKRTAEQALAREKSIVAAQVTTIQELGERLAAAEARVPGLEAEVKRLRAAFPDARLTHVTTASTGPVAIPAPPEPPPSPDPPPARGHGRTCLLWVGDTGRIDVAEARLETRAGTQLVAGAAVAYRLNPEERLFGGPFAAPVTAAGVVPPPAPGLSRLECAAWGVGAALAGALAGEVDARLRH